MSDERRARIEAKLAERLEASHAQVLDESHLHAGHEGAKSGGGHFRATLVSARFEGLSRLAAQRLVYEMIDDEFQSGSIHALAMRTFTPAKWAEAQA